MVCVSCQRVSNIIITYIDHQVYILSTYGFSKDTFGFTRTETRYAGIDQIILFLISGESNIILVLVSAFAAPFNKVIIYLISKLFTAK